MKDALKQFQRELIYCYGSLYEYSKDWCRRNGFKSPYEYQKSLAVQRGYKNYEAYLTHLAKKRGFRSRGEEEKYNAEKRGFATIMDLYHYRARLAGFKNYYERRKIFNSRTSKRTLWKKLGEQLSENGFFNKQVTDLRGISDINKI